MVNIVQCHVCHQTFTRGSMLKDHIKKIHQRLTTVTFSNGSIVNVERGEDGAFLCRCNRRFTVPSTLRRHAKWCNARLEMRGEDVVWREQSLEEDMYEDSEEETLGTNCVGEYLFFFVDSFPLN